MGNKEDWEELEKWNESKKAQYGINLTNMEKEKDKLDNWTKKLKIFGKTLKIGWIIILIMLIKYEKFILCGCKRRY